MAGILRAHVFDPHVQMINIKPRFFFKIPLKFTGLLRFILRIIAVPALHIGNPLFDRNRTGRKRNAVAQLNQQIIIVISIVGKELLEFRNRCFRNIDLPDIIRNIFDKKRMRNANPRRFIVAESG